MDRPVFLVDNGFNTLLYPAHTLVGNQEAAGHEAFRVANSRRSPLDYWTPTSLNAQATLTLTCDAVRAFDLLALDRGHNLAGKQVVCECSDDNFGTTQTVVDVVLPSYPGTGSLDDALGVVTEEGAWLKRFPKRAATYWRLRIPAMGAGLKPQIVGAWLGASYSPANLFRPASPDQGSAQSPQALSSALWMGRGPRGWRREGEIRLQFTSLFDYEEARYHLHAQFHRQRRSMWVVFDEDMAERALLAVTPDGRWGFAREPQWFAERASVPFLEHEPEEVS